MEISGMDYVKLGDTGMDISRICLGCMSFGSGEWGDLYGQKLLEDTLQEKCSGAICWYKKWRYKRGEVDG
jgi:hypothetical protein